MDNLMVLVDEGTKFEFKPLEKGEEKIVKIEELKNLGFITLAKKLEDELMHDEKLSRIAQFGYITIKENQIEAYLKKKADKYNESHKKKNISNHIGWSLSSQIVYSASYDSFIKMEQYAERDKKIDYLKSLEREFRAVTNDYHSNESGSIGMYKWTEVPIELYETIPPASVLKSVEVHQARCVFDYMTIASVNAVVDPLLLGRVHGRSEAWFIDQWGDDVNLDDVI